ncbi:hypothetical protein C4E04_02465 [Microvirga sp. 17 mud 1-3]|nr:hypothetical protein C4E04_02465 [Microvirga sp. 17 mud 1-3]
MLMLGGQHSQDNWRTLDEDSLRMVGTGSPTLCRSASGTGTAAPQHAVLVRVPSISRCFSPEHAAKARFTRGQHMDLPTIKHTLVQIFLHPR